ncbi:hypothetical protein IWQ56_007323, partial [Coemansia nantahalensis]
MKLIAAFSALAAIALAGDYTAQPAYGAVAPAPEYQAPVQAAPEYHAPEQAAPEYHAPEQAAPEYHAPAQAAP